MEKKETIEQARELVNTLEEKKAENIVLIDIREIAIFTDFFVICSGTSDRMLRALVRAAEETMKKNFNVKGRVIGEPANGWIAIDFTDIVLHIFSPKKREYYQLEDLWSEGKTLLRVA